MWRALAGGQGGVLLTAQAGEGGWTRPRLRRLLGRCGWARIQPGAWLEPGRAMGVRQWLWLHQLLRPVLVVSHWAAAMLHGVETRVERVDFIAPPGAACAAVRSGVVHRLPLGEDEVTTVAGLRTTMVARTMADLLRTGPRDDALVAVDSALGWRHGTGVEQRGARRPPLAPLDAIGRALTAAPELRGARTAAWWLAMADPRSGSPAETVARLRMRDAGLCPETQVPLVSPVTGRRVYPDFLFRAQGLVVEVEGYEWHGTRAQHQRDVLRFNDLATCPEVRRILRFTTADVYRRPEGMIRDIRQALAVRRGPPAVVSPGPSPG